MQHALMLLLSRRHDTAALYSPAGLRLSLCCLRFLWRGSFSFALPRFSLSDDPFTAADLLSMELAQEEERAAVRSQMAQYREDGLQRFHLENRFPDASGESWTPASPHHTLTAAVKGSMVLISQADSLSSCFVFTPTCFIYCLVGSLRLSPSAFTEIHFRARQRQPATVAPMPECMAFMHMYSCYAPC